VKSYTKHINHYSSRISRKSSFDAWASPGSQAGRTNSEVAHNLDSRRIDIQKRNQAKINSHIQELHRNVEAIVERINKIKTKIGVVRSKAVSIRTVINKKEENRNE
jgi:hypothetical protein